MTNDEKELMQDLINQASSKIKLLQKTIIEKDIEIKQLKEGYARVQEQLRVQKLFAKYQIVSDKEIKAQLKQAKIDVLNEVKARCVETFTGKRIISAVDIDKIIAEIEEQ